MDEGRKRMLQRLTCGVGALPQARSRCSRASTGRSGRTTGPSCNSDQQPATSNQQPVQQQPAAATCSPILAHRPLPSAKLFQSQRADATVRGPPRRCMYKNDLGVIRPPCTRPQCSKQPGQW